MKNKAERAKRPRIPVVEESRHRQQEDVRWRKRRREGDKGEGIKSA
jgi:hypothetical protein